MASSPEQAASSLANLIDYLGDEEAGRRGLSYATGGRVKKVTWEGADTFEAAVQGSRARPYRVTVHLADADNQDTECSCPMMGDCKHVAAAALRIAGEAYLRGYDWAYGVEELLPAGWRRSGLAKLPALEGEVLGPLAAAPRKHMHMAVAEVPAALQAIVAPQSAAKAAPKETKAADAGAPWWRRYLNAPDRNSANVILLEVYKKHAFGGHTSWYTDTLPPVLAREDNRLDALARYEQEVNHAVRYYGRGKRFDDAELREFLASDEAREMREAQARRVHEQRFFAWLDAPRTPAANAARAAVQWMEYSQGDGMPILCFQLLASSRKLQRSARTPQAIRQLSDDVRGMRRNMPELEARLVHWLGARVNNYPENFTPGERKDYHPLLVLDVLEWLTRWSAYGLLEWEDGSKVEFDPAPARLVLRPSAGGQLEWRVALPAWGETPAREVPVKGARLVREFVTGVHTYYQYREDRAPAVLHRDGALVRYVDTAAMPTDVLDAVYQLGVVSAERLRETGTGARLSRKLGMRGNVESDAAICQGVPVRARFELRLDEDKQLTVSATAVAADETVFNRLPEGDWIVLPRMAVAPEAGLSPLVAADDVPAEPTPEAAPVPETAIAVVPREQDVAPLDAWLAKFLPASAETVVLANGAAGQTWRLTANLYRDLLTLWGLRPRGVDYLGNKALLDVLIARRVPKFKMKIESSGMDWLSVSLQLEEEMEYLTYEEVMGALTRSQEKLVQLSGGRYYDRAELEEYKEKLELLAKMGMELSAKEQRVHAMQLAGDTVKLLVAEADTQVDLAPMLKRFRELTTAFKGVPTLRFDPRLAKLLRPYQKTGAEFVVWACKNLGGALLADDMGLGKTLQTLAAICALRPKAVKDRRPSLVICPASVAHNWRREVERFAPWLKTIVIERGAERKELLARAGEYDIVIKNYALARRDIEELKAHEWLVVCVDEAQAIKNPQSDIARTVKGLNARHRIALTGTPIENRLSDLWSIVDFCVPGYFGTLTHFDAGGRARGAQLTGQIVRNKLRPLLLRRMKAEVAPELPPRVEERLDCVLPPPQRKTYLAELKRTRMLLDAMPDKQAERGPGKIRILAALTRLRQICCDPALVGFPEDGSGKVEVLMDLLPPLFESGHKVLIFSQFVRMLERLKPRLRELGAPMFVLTGATTGRQELVEAFEAAPAPAVFLISLKAGGTGLNLTSASHVVLFDPWWNPAVEAQAIDRTHRIGQDKTVVAFRLVAAGTIEERILDLQAKKQTLVKNVLEADAFNRSLSRDDLAYLLQAGD